MSGKRTIGRWLSYILLTALLTGCATTDSGITRGVILIPKSYEVALGRALAAAAVSQYGTIGNKEIEDYINEIGQRLARVSDRPDLEYSFQVLDSPEVNAFAAPGGFIFVTRGLLELADNEAEVATVLAHELGHVSAYHGVKRLQTVLGSAIVMAIVFHNSEEAQEYSDYVNIAWNLMMLGYSRGNEYQADQLGLYYAAHAGYDPYQMATFFEKLKEEHGQLPRLLVWLSTHPRIDDRIERIPKVVSQYHLDQNATPEIGEERYRRIVRGELDENLEYGVRDVFHLMLDAFRGEDIDAFMEHIADDYSADGEDARALRSREQQFFAEFDGIAIEIADLTTTLKGNRAFLQYGFTMHYSKGEDESYEEAGTQRITFRRDEDTWLVTAIENLA